MELLFLILIICRIHLTLQNIVTMAQGKVRGTSRHGYVSYNGIPYASVSTGPGGRFKRGGIAPVWSDVREPRESHCYPRSAAGECVQLDVNTPFGSSLPVLVWVTGGSGQYDPTILVKEGIIVVIVRHRLGPQGFLCSSEDKIPGNAGLKDVVQALRWVRDNIVAFNGDPNKVVLAGQSFGAAMVESLMLTPTVRGLFHGVILQSGTVLAPWAFNFDAENRAKLLRMKFNGSNEFTALTRATAEDLAAKTDELMLPYFPFGICKENSVKNEERLISVAPFDMLSKGVVTSVPMLMGYNNNEGYIFASTLKYARVLRKMSKDKSFLLPMELQSSKRDASKVIKEVDDMYFTENRTMESVLTYHRDAYFLSHVHRSVRLHAFGPRPVYYYQFSYVGDAGVDEEPGMAKSGAAHSDELAYLFPERGRAMHGEDGAVQENLVRLWTNFVKHLNPTPGRTERFIWTAVNPHDPELLDINTEMEMIKFPFKKQAQMWEELYDKYYFDRRDRRTL